MTDRSPERPQEEPKPSASPTRSRPEPEVEQPAPKRVRSNADDKGRGKRLFGNLLGTLQKFKTEDKSSRVTEAAKRREELSERITKKLQSETALNHDIQETDRELKTLRIATETAEAIWRQKEIALSSRHALLKPTAHFLHTALPLPHPPAFETNLLNPAPIPLSAGPTRDPPVKSDLPPLYFLPKILMPHQDDLIKSQVANIDELISEEVAALAAEREQIRTTAKENKKRMEELSAKLSELRKQVKTSKDKDRDLKGGGTEKSESGLKTDELGRAPREEMMEVDDDKSKEDKSRGDKVKDVRDEKEKGVKIEGDEGDIEVEY
ncbi:hypothetical protein I312_104511 [Cryptococcus bacillisporus CA1280]|uniref:Pinin/SDK/MemA protein domain-containing protein n=1 Tax=Cryptococcus bacillisporus CA1280 TaxID=1296109 RepID=A0A0D0VHR8_CRYGA|nr:hypothetical protein I312_04576 [Cryptococcus bacillisporus CA1280]